MKSTKETKFNNAMMNIYRQALDAGRATVVTPYRVVHGALDVAVGQRGYS